MKKIIGSITMFLIGGLALLNTTLMTDIDKNLNLDSLVKIAHANGENNSTLKGYLMVIVPAGQYTNPYVCPDGAMGTETYDRTEQTICLANLGKLKICTEGGGVESNHTNNC